MSHLPKTIPEGDEWGPAMKPLAPRHRAFCVAYVTTANGNATQAAKDAGYTDNDTGALKVTAYRLVHQPRILAGIRETVVARVASNLPVYVNALESVALNAQHKDQTKALLALMNRGGLPDVTERNINVNVNVSSAEKVAEIRQMAEELGLDPNKLLGNVTDATDAEFEVIPPGLEGVW